jgi:hypothetical protein
MAPPLMALSLTVITQRAPETKPMPVMIPPPEALSAPSSSCIFHPARGDSSMKSVPRSSSVASRSRGKSCPRWWNLAAILLELARTRASKPRSSSTRRRLASRFSPNPGDPFSARGSMTAMGCQCSYLGSPPPC